MCRSQLACRDVSWFAMRASSCTSLTFGFGWFCACCHPLVRRLLQLARLSGKPTASYDQVRMPHFAAHSYSTTRCFPVFAERAVLAQPIPFVVAIRCAVIALFLSPSLTALRALREQVLAAAQELIKAGARNVMVRSSALDCRCLLSSAPLPG